MTDAPFPFPMSRGEEKKKKHEICIINFKMWIASIQSAKEKQAGGRASQTATLTLSSLTSLKMHSSFFFSSCGVSLVLSQARGDDAK